MLTAEPTTTQALTGQAFSKGGTADPPVFYTVRRFCEPRALPRSTFYKLVKAGQIHITKRGTRSLIHVAEANRYDNTLLEKAA